MGRHFATTTGSSTSPSRVTCRRYTVSWPSPSRPRDTLPTRNGYSGGTRYYGGRGWVSTGGVWRKTTYGGRRRTHKTVFSAYRRYSATFFVRCYLITGGSAGKTCVVGETTFARPPTK